ncbi:Cyclin-dependent kinase B2-1 [Spatholobus suberectus]|nr:Cyclin-dependent kinase B2-1 [Spatholobus suberectus]
MKKLEIEGKGKPNGEIPESAEGSYGKVYLAVEKASTRMVALKKIRFEINVRNGIDSTILREIAILRTGGQDPQVRGHLLLQPQNKANFVPRLRVRSDEVLGTEPAKP